MPWRTGARGRRAGRGRCVGGIVAPPGEHEHALLADLHEPRPSTGCASAASSSGTNRPEWSIRPAETSWPGRRRGPTRTCRRGRVADHLEGEVVARDEHPRSRPRPPASRSGSVRPRRRARLVRPSPNPLVRAERDLGVSADVDESRRRRSRVRTVRHPRDDVAADVGAEPGKTTAGARGWMRTPKSAAVAGGSRRAVMMNGATASGSGSMPSAIWVIVTLPHRPSRRRALRRPRPRRTPRPRAG